MWTPRWQPGELTAPGTYLGLARPTRHKPLAATPKVPSTPTTTQSLGRTFSSSGASPAPFLIVINAQRFLYSGQRGQESGSLLEGAVMTKQNDHPPKKDEDEDEWEEVGTETVTGAIVSVEWARSHPDSCVVNRVKKPKTP
jgi:hypothetical protein